MHPFAWPWLAGVLLRLCLLPGAAAHESSDATKKEISQVIETQLAAFRSNDFAKGFTFASRDLQTVYSAADFEAMVRKSYPAIARSASADFGATLDTGDEAMIDVRVRGAAGVASGDFRYRLRKEDDQWRITGVLEIKPNGLTV